MASWIVHLRIADKLLDRIPNLSPTEFIVGNIAPDSGVPNEDWSAFSPPTSVSHFKAGDQKANPEAFAAKYFTRRRDYNREQYSFYLGYLTHLMTDLLWSEQIARPALDRAGKTDAPDREAYIRQLKKDWYDLDFKYLRDHPGFRGFRLYREAVDFRNDYMAEFSPEAFENRRQYITAFYLAGREDLDREYPYLTEVEMDLFVDTSVHGILDSLHTNYRIKL